MTSEEFKTLALAMPGAIAYPHFEKTAFKTKKIFATLDEQNNRACLMLSPEEQSLLCLYDRTVIYPVPNKWGLKGATYVELGKVMKGMLKDGLKQACECSLAKKPAAKR